MKIDPDHLVILAAIVDGGGVVEGAARLGRSQPSLSRTLAALEARIGEPLFERSRRPLRPTELGALLAAQGRRILEAGQMAEAALDRYRSGRAGLLRVGGTPYFMDGVVASRIAAFQTEHADVRIEQRYGYWAELRQLLLDGALDAAICPIRPAAPGEGLRAVRLLAGRNVIACRRDHPLRLKRSLALRDIGGFPWLAPPEGSPLHSDLTSVLAAIGLEAPRIVFSGGSLGSVLNMITASDALTVLPYSVVFTQRRQFPVEALNIRVDHPDRDLCLVAAEARRPSPVARKFERFIRAAFEAMAQTIVHAETQALWQRDARPERG